VGAILAVSPAMVRHYSKRAATFMPDRSGAARMKRGDAAREGRNKCNDFKLVTPTEEG